MSFSLQPTKYVINQQSTKNIIWSNVATENVILYTSEGRKYTDLTKDVMQRVSTSLPGLGTFTTPIQDFMRGSGRVRSVPQDTIRWKLKGTGITQAVATENLNPDVEWVGAGGLEFGHQLDVEWYGDGDVLCPEGNRMLQVVVKGNPVGDGAYYNYIFQTNTGEYFPQQYLEPGIRWIKLGSIFGESSSGYGTYHTMGNSWIEFETTMTDYGKDFEWTNKATIAAKTYVITPCDMQNNPLRDQPVQFIDESTADFKRQVEMEKELMLFYGVAAGKHIIDQTSGLHRRMGPGILEFLLAGNPISYDIESASIEMFKDRLLAVWYDTVAPDKRNIVIYTGQGGYDLWQNMVFKTFAVNPVQIPFDVATRSATSLDPANHEARKVNTVKFTEIALEPWGSMRVELWPVLDNRALNGGKVNPANGLPESSYWFIIMDYGVGDGAGEGNMMLLEQENTYAFNFITGTYGPMGALSSGKGVFQATHGGRNWRLTHSETFGAVIFDVTRTAIFMPNFAF